MIIDVMDMHLENLRFSGSYDPARYKRGQQLYRNEAVNLKEIDKVDENKYKVEAEVEGANGIYDTHIEINNDVINKSKCVCECADYDNGNLCKHIIATAIECLNPHGPSTKKRALEEEKRKIAELEKKKNEIAYNKKYHTSLEVLEHYKENLQGNNYSDNLDLGSLYDKVQMEKDSKPVEHATQIKLEYYIQFGYRHSIDVFFKIGQKRMYNLSNILKFYEAYESGEELSYGKQLSFIPKRENFVDESKPLFDLIIKYGEIMEYSSMADDYRYTTSSDLKCIKLIGKEIDEFFELCKKNGDSILVKNSGYKMDDEIYQFSDEKPDIHCVLSKENSKNLYYWYDGMDEKTEEYVLRLNHDYDNVIVTTENMYLFYGGKIYKTDIDEKLTNTLTLFSYSKEIILPKDKLEEYRKIVFPQLETVEIKDLPEEKPIEAEIVNKLASKILLDLDDDGNILLELKFCYQDYEFNVLEKGYEKYVKEHDIIRNFPEETKVIERIFKDGFYYTENRKNFIMKNEDDIYKFLTDKIKEYMEDFEVLATDRFKNKQIKHPKISNIGIRIDNGLLELDISKMNIDIDEVKNVLKNYKIKKKYYKLKNGDFLDLSANKDLDLLDEMEQTLDIDYSKFKNGVIELPVNRSFYLEKLTEKNNDIHTSKNEEFNKLVDGVENSEISEKIKIDKDFEDKLRDYQKVGYKWLKTLEKYGFGGILADDMGLGKTLQIIAVLKSELNSKKRETSIVVCPSTLVLNWQAEVEKWCNNIKVLIISGTAKERKEKLEKYQDYDLVITSYDLLKRDVENYNDKHFKFIIADEAQYIKNSATQNATSLKSLNGKIKFALTGTPIENSVAELWSIFDFIMPGYLYSYNKFKKKFEEPILKQNDEVALKRLKRLISPFVLRRVKEDVLTELPEKNIIVMKNEMKEEQEKIYLSYFAQTKKEVKEELQQSGNFEKSKFKILMLLTRLRQICCHPSMFIENYKGGSGKLDQCMNLIDDAISAGHKILLFSSYTSMFDIIEKELEKRKIKYFKLVGSTKVDKRIEIVDEFNNDDSVKVFLISLKAGGTGLNLTSADVVIHYDPWWNVSSENQATDRAYRIGQKNSVQVYKLITSNSIEEKINKMQERKAKLAKDVLNTEQTFINQMSKDEIMDLFE